MRTRNIIIGLLVVSGALGAGGYVLWRERRVPDSAKAPITVIVKTLQLRLGQARTSQLLKACAERSCSCVAAASAAGVEAAPKSVLALLDTVGSRCQNGDLAAVRVEAQARLGQRESARKAAEALVQRQPASGFAYEALAYTYFAEGNMPKALELASKAEQNKRGAAAAELAGLAAFYQHDFVQAAAAFTRALKLEDTDTDLLYNYALATQNSGRYLEPREAYLKLLRQRPDYTEARYNLCLLLHAVGASAEAQHHFEKLAKAEPNSADVAHLRVVLAQPPAEGAVLLGPLGDSAAAASPAAPAPAPAP